MHWRLKSALFRTLSCVPGGQSLYEYAQRKITRSLVPTASRVGQKVDVALRYARWVRDHEGNKPLQESTHVDFGAGWHPAIPFTFFSLGIERQILMDLRPVMLLEDVLSALTLFRNVAPEKARSAGMELMRLPEVPIHGASRTEIFRDLGITYDAPYRDLAECYREQIDLVTSTQVLLHIPETALENIFRQLFCALRPGGVFLATIHLYPLFGGLSTHPERLRHLTYSPEAWERFGSRMMSYNRLKAPDYRRLLESAGFVIRDWDVTPGSEEDLHFLKKLPLEPSFKDYDPHDLVARHLFFAAGKLPRNAD